MRPHIVGPDGAWHRPFVHPLRLVSRLEQTYEEDASRAVPLEFLAGGTTNAQLERTYILDENILRFLTIQLNKKALEARRQAPIVAAAAAAA